MKPVVVAMLVMAPAVALGSTGGPSVARVLGWQAQEQKVFVSIIYNDESAALEKVVYFDLGRPGPWKPSVVQWSLRSEKHDARLAALLARLRPLIQVPAPTIPRWTKILKADSIRGMYDFPRYRLQIGALGYYALELTTVRDPAATVPTLWSIPGRKERLAIVSAITQPFEEGYETQTPVIIGPIGMDPSHPIQVEPIPHP